MKSILITILLIGLMGLLFFFAFPTLAPYVFLLFAIAITLVVAKTGTREAIFAIVFSTLILIFLHSHYQVDQPYIELKHVMFLITTGLTTYIIHRVKNLKDVIETQKTNLQVISDSITDALVTLDTDSNILYCNSAVKDIFGWECEEVSKMKITDLMPERFRAMHLAGVKRYLESGQKKLNWSSVEAVGLKKDGSEFPIEISFGEYIEDGDRKFSGVLRDITFRKTYELKMSQLANIVESSDDAIISKDLNGIIQSWNRGAQQIFGYSESEAVGKHISLIFPSELISEEDIILGKIKNNENIKHYETRRKAKDGRLLDVSLTVSPMRDSFGKIIGASKIARDVTSRKELERELKKSEERYKAFIKNSSEGIWRMELEEPYPINLPVADQLDWIYANGYLAECNDAMAEMYGFRTGEELMGTRIGEILPRNKDNEEYLTKFIENGYNLEDAESVETDKEGNIKYFINSLTGFTRENRVIRAWGVQRDITAKKTYLLEKEQLLKEMTLAKQLAEMANREKDRFLASISHELRTPLVSVLGYANMLKSGLLKGDDAVDAINTIQKNAQLQVDLIEDLLDLSRIIAGKVSINMTHFPIREIIDNAVQTVKHTAISKGLSIREEVEDMQVYADPKRISQILLNLLSNAIKFTDEGLIKVSARKVASHLVLTVTDTGIGIKEEHLPRIFKQFVQIDDSMTKKYGGLGLGLSIVKQLTEAHGGTVSVESEWGKGSSFIIKIPLITGVEEIKRTNKTISFSGVSILITEDNTDTAGFLEAFYKSYGAEVSVAHSAQQAREILEEKKFNLYIFDISMPDETGYQLISGLRKTGDMTPACALTAFSSAEFEKEAYIHGFNKYVKKPATEEELLELRLLTIENKVV